MDIEHATKEELLEIKKWFFKENMRLQQEKTALENERKAFEDEKNNYESEFKKDSMKVNMSRKQLDREKKIFDMKWKMLEEELYKLATEKDEFNREKKELQFVGKHSSYEIFFVGVNNADSLKKRYKELLKIFHPDNLNGDTRTLQEINKEYDSLKRIFV